MVIMTIGLVSICLHKGSVSALETIHPPMIEVKDFRGKQLVFSKPVNRIVCLLDSALNGIYMLGAQEKIVGVSATAYTGSSARYYAAMDARMSGKLLPVVSSSSAASLEQILALKPELVIVFSLNKETITALEERGIAVFGVSVECVEDIYKEVLALGEITGTANRAKELVDDTRKEIATVRERISAVPKMQWPRTYFMWAKGELDSGGRKSIVQEVLEISGAVNVCGHIDQEHVVINMEDLLMANPQVIIMWHNELLDPADILQKPAWKALPAAKNDRIHEIPDLFSCDLWTLNFQYSVKLIAAWCHPELFNDVDFGQEKEKILQRLYGTRLSKKLMAFETQQAGPGL